MRYLFEIAYNGSAFHGWQRQKNANSVQETVEEALSRICRQETTIMGSGRTDTGVHCEQQYFHADFEKPIEPEKLKYKLNSYLDRTISIQSVRAIKEEAHARFDAVSRSYQYRITTEKWPFNEGLTYYFSKPLNIKTMNDAASLLIGEHDFQAFSRVKTEVNNFLCTITEAEWRQSQNMLTFYISANRFLRGMVRAIVGTLLDVGEGKLTINQFEEIIEKKDRRQAGSAAPPQGLYLTEVKYPKDIFQ